MATHFARRTELTRYLDATYKKVCQIHKRLPEGGVLVFLTGKREILHMCRRLSRALNKQRGGAAVATAAAVDDDTESNQGSASRRGRPGDLVVREIDDDEDDGDAFGTEGEDVLESDDDDDDDDVGDDDVELDNEIDAPLVAGGEDRGEMSDPPAEESESEDPLRSEAVRARMLSEVLGFSVRSSEGDNGIAKGLASEEKEEKDEEVGISGTPQVHAAGPDIAAVQPLRALVLPLFAMMSPRQQAKVFQPPPPGHRLIVIATNVAETSITIPGIRYVVDCGRQKERVREAGSGIRCGVFCARRNLLWRPC